MSEDTTVAEQTENAQEEQDLNLETETVEGEEDFAEKARKAEEIAKNQRIRAEKAEKELKALKGSKTEKETPKNDLSGMSLKDIRALQNVHDDDVEKVEKWAKSEGITIAEAVKDPMMQTFFKTRNEERATADAASTGAQKKRSRGSSDDEIMGDIEKGKVPENPEDLVKAEIAQKKKAAGIKD